MPRSANIDACRWHKNENASLKHSFPVNHTFPRKAHFVDNPDSNGTLAYGTRKARTRRCDGSHKSWSSPARIARRRFTPWRGLRPQGLGSTAATHVWVPAPVSCAAAPPPGSGVDVLLRTPATVTVAGPGKLTPACAISLSPQAVPPWHGAARRKPAAGASLANWRLAQSVEGNGNRYGHQQKDGGRPQRAGPRGLGLASLAGLLITAPHGVPSSASFARPVP